MSPRVDSRIKILYKTAVNSFTLFLRTVKDKSDKDVTFAKKVVLN